MLYFSQRLKLAQAYEEYIKNNSIKDCPESVITFLSSNDLLDEEKCKEYIKTIDNKN